MGGVFPDRPGMSPRSGVNKGAPRASGRAMLSRETLILWLCGASARCPRLMAGNPRFILCSGLRRRKRSPGSCSEVPQSSQRMSLLSRVRPSALSPVGMCSADVSNYPRLEHFGYMIEWEGATLPDALLGRGLRKTWLPHRLCEDPGGGRPSQENSSLPDGKGWEGAALP